MATLCIASVLSLVHMTWILSQAFLLDDINTQDPSFRLTYSPSRITRGITHNVTLLCEHDGATPPKFQEVSRIRIMKQTASPLPSMQSSSSSSSSSDSSSSSSSSSPSSPSGWVVLVEKTMAGNVTMSRDDNVSVTGALAKNINDTFLQLTWAAASEDTFGRYRCDVIGLDQNLGANSESTQEVELVQQTVTNDELLTFLLQTRAQIASLDRDVNRHLDDVGRELDDVKEDALSRGDVAAWFEGSYALLQPRSGCPVDLTFLGGDASYFVVHTESSSPTKNENRYSKALPLSTTTKINGNVNLFTLRFCEARRDFSSRRWPYGNYCINKIAGEPCPSGLDEGQIYLDAEDTNTTTDLRGNVVKEFGDRANLEFCCKSASSTVYKMRMPTHSPFLLYRKGGSCEQVYDMKVSEEIITIDTEDNNNGDAISGVTPDINTLNTNAKPVTFFLCYYTKS